MMQNGSTASPTQHVEVMASHAMRRRSSISVAPPDVPTPARDAVTPSLVVGDKSARPHFLKERSATMRSRISITSPSTPAPYGSQSKASSFLLGLVERSHSSPSHFEPPKPAPHQASPDTVPRSVGQRRSGTMIEPMEPPPSDPATGRRKSILRVEPPSGLTASALPSRQRVPSLQSIRSGLGSLEAHTEDEQEYVSETELREKPLKELVRDLELYAKKHAPLLRILNEIHRRLQDAEMDVGHGPTHLPLCGEIVDADVLKFTAQTMREFRFDVSLQMAAISLLSFLADVSDIYAFMMAELDIEPLVQKVVADHVSQERLVMNGSTLFHAISESKRKSHVIKEHKARQVEKEKKRAASFVQVFATGLYSSKPKLSIKNAVDDRRLNELHRPGSRWQRSALSASLGAPPLLTAHYDLEIASTGRRAVAIPPLERTPSADGEESLQLNEGFHDWRPMTSPEPPSSDLSSRFRSLTSPSATHAAAIYSKSPMFVAPSPLAERMSVRRTQSATALKRQSSQRRTRTSVSKARQLPPQVFNCEDEAVGESNDHGPEEASEMGACNEEHDPDIESPSEANNEEYNREREPPGKQEETEENDDDPAYDDDFADEEDEEEEEKGETNESQLEASQGRLLPVGSDSELMELVDNPENIQESQQPQESPREDASPVRGSLVAVNSDSELLAMIEKCSDLPSMVLELDDDPVTTELVGLLSTCVNSENPTATPSSVGSGSQPAANTPKPRRKKKAAPSSPSVSAWAPPSTIVRPVSRRIMDKTVKTTKRALVAPRTFVGSQSREKSGVVTTTITTILDRINAPKEDAGENSSPTSGPEDPPPATGFVHVPEPCSTPTTSISQIQALYARGLQHHKADELDAAIKCYEAGIKLQHSSGVEREFASLYINVGSAKMAQQKLSDALVAFTHAERIQPHNTKAIFNSGLVLMQLERWEEAKAKLEAVILLDSSHIRAQAALQQCVQATQR